MSARAFLARLTRARAASERLILLQGAIARDVVLTPCDFDLRRPLIEVGLREQFAVEEHLRALEVPFREIEVGARVGNLRHFVHRELRSVSEPEAADDLSGVRVGLGNLGFHLGRCNPDEGSALTDARASLDRRRDDAALYFRGDFGFFLRRQSAGHFEESLNGSLDGRCTADSDRWSGRSCGGGLAFDVRSAADGGRQEERQC